MQTVASTLKNYLDLFRPPHTTIDAQERCLADAERLADRVFGIIEASAEVDIFSRTKTAHRLLPYGRRKP